MLDKGSKKSNPLVLINEISIPSADVHSWHLLQNNNFSYDLVYISCILFQNYIIKY